MLVDEASVLHAGTTMGCAASIGPTQPLVSRDTNVNPGDSYSFV